MAPTLAQIFRYCPRCGVDNVQFGPNPFRCEGCDFQFYFGPAVAVGAIVTDRLGQILFLRRARDPGKGKLGLPGGFVDVGESAEQALRREVHEETGLVVDSMSYVTSFPNTYIFAGVALPVTDIFYHVLFEKLDALQPDKAEVEDWLLCHPTKEQFDQMAFDSNRQAILYFLSRAPNRKGP